jgi:hypothetical protein
MSCFLSLLGMKPADGVLISCAKPNEPWTPKSHHFMGGIAKPCINRKPLKWLI